MRLKTVLALAAGPAVLLTPTLAMAAATPPPAPPDTGTTAWMLTSTALVLLMIPGLAMFYGGLVRTKNVLGTMMHSFGAMAVVGVLWVICGYSFAFGHNVLDGILGWDWSKFFLYGTDSMWYTTTVNGHTVVIPELVFAMFQGKFAIIAPALIAGAFAERVRFRGYCVFIVLWSLLVYNPLAHIIWGGGFLTGDAIDYAGGTVIHISAGVSGLIAALYLGSRRGYPKTAMRPNNLTMSLIGAGLLWVGWFGFNAGSSVASGMHTAQALTVTQAAAAAGALMWMVLEGCFHKKATSLGIASGVIAGLVAITPAAGAVMVWGALILGAAASVICYFGLRIKNSLGYDDSLDVFGIHGVAGIVGAIGLTFLLRDVPDWGIAVQLWHQVAGVLVSIGFSAVLTYIIIVVVEKTVGFKLSEEGEMEGLDHTLHGEHAYGLLNMD